MVRKFSLILLIGLSAAAAQAQVPPEARPLTPGQTIERVIAGGESHTFQISLVAGQFARFRMKQRAIDAALILAAPDGKQLVEMNLTRAGDEESLSVEAAASGDYKMTVRADGLASIRGTYRLEAVVKTSATEPDKQRITAEALMIEADNLLPQAGKGAPKIIENMQKAVSIWRAE